MMTGLFNVIAGQLAIIAGAIITAFTIIKLNHEYQKRKVEETRITALESKAGKSELASQQTEIASLQETIKNMKSERETIIKGFQQQFKDFEEEIEKLEKLIKEGNNDALNECREMRKHMNQFIQETFQLFIKNK